MCFCFSCQFSESDIVEWIDQNLCLFLQDSIGLLLDAVKTSNEDLAQTWKKSEQWATIEQLCSKSLWISHTLTQLKLSFCGKTVSCLLNLQKTDNNFDNHQSH